MPRIGNSVICTNKCEIIGGIWDSVEFIIFVLIGGFLKEIFKS